MAKYRVTTKGLDQIVEASHASVGQAGDLTLARMEPSDNVMLPEVFMVVRAFAAGRWLEVELVRDDPA